MAVPQAVLSAAEGGVHAAEILRLFLGLELLEHSFDLGLLLMDDVLLLLQLAVDAGSIVSEAEEARAADGAEAAAPER